MSIGTHPTLRFPGWGARENVCVAEAADAGSTIFMYQDVRLRHAVYVNCDTIEWDGWMAYRPKVSMTNTEIMNPV
jgi:hypothetical protein